MKRWLLIILLSIGIIACNKPKEDAIVVGTIAGPETQLVEAAKEEAFKRFGLRVKIVEFSDYNLNNEALLDGSLDANVYKHKTYLKSAMKARGYPFEIIAKTLVYPMGVYSEKYKNINQIPDNAIIAIPNDPSNETRALKLMAKEGLIKAKKIHKNTINPLEAYKNPHKFNFKPMDAAQLPRVLPDVDAAIINTSFAIPAGLSPAKDALIIETKDSPYANLVVIRKDSKKKKELKLFIKAFQSDPVKEKAKILFNDGAV